MKFSIYKCILSFAFILVFAGCATHGSHKIGPTPIVHATAEIPENQLLDVGILVFESKELTPKKAEKEGTNANIRKAESHFIPYHLKNTLHQSGHWGAIQVIPAETNSVDLLVKGKIIESNGETLNCPLISSEGLLTSRVINGFQQKKVNILIKVDNPVASINVLVKNPLKPDCAVPSLVVLNLEI